MTTYAFGARVPSNVTTGGYRHYHGSGGEYYAFIQVNFSSFDVRNNTSTYNFWVWTENADAYGVYGAYTFGYFAVNLFGFSYGQLDNAAFKWNYDWRNEPAETKFYAINNGQTTITHNSTGAVANNVFSGTSDMDQPAGLSTTHGDATWSVTYTTPTFYRPRTRAAVSSVTRTGYGTSVTVVSGNDATAPGTPTSPNASAYQYQQSTDGTTWGAAITLGTSKTSVITGLNEATTYYYRTCGTLSGVQIWSNEALVIGAVDQGSTLRYTTRDTHGYAVGDSVTITGVSPSGYNLTGTISAVNATNRTFDITTADNPGTYSYLASANGGLVTGPVRYLGVAYAAPTITTVSSVGTTATVTLAAPADNGGSAISSYTIDYSTDSTFATYSSSSGLSTGATNINNLTPGRTYYFRAKYINAASVTSPYTKTINNGATLASTFIAAYGRRYNSSLIVTGVTAVGTSTTYRTSSQIPYAIGDYVSVTSLAASYNSSGTVTAVTPTSFTLGSTTPTTTTESPGQPVPYTGNGLANGWVQMFTGKRYDADGTSPGVPGWVDVGTAQRYDSTGVWKAFS